MASNNILKLLHALDTAPIQRYHFTATGIGCIGFFTVAYNIFCINNVSNLLGRLYYDPHKVDEQGHPIPGKLPTDMDNLITGVALVGSLIGQLLLGLLGDKLGRKRVYGVTLLVAAVFAICSGVPFGGFRAKSSIGTLCFFRFCLGFALGGLYPLSASFVSEYANKRNRGTMIATVFAMQGVGIIFAGLVPMILSKIFLHYYPPKPFKEGPVLSTQPEADILWRVVLAIGALPAMLTYYLHMKMPETGRYTALIKGDATQAVADMRQVLDIEIQEEPNRLSQFKAANNYPLPSGEFFERHGIHLIGTMSTWCLLDIAFYSQQLTQSDLVQALELKNQPSNGNALSEVFETSRAMCIIALLGTVPGYWFTCLFIECLGRFTIQLVGFFMMSVFMLIMGVKYDDLKNHNENSNLIKRLFALIYGLTYFFANFGANATTFILPAELFPTRVRSTCHGLSAAAGKLGAIIGTFVVQPYTLEGDVKKKRHALMVLAFTNMLGFCCTFLLTETRGRSLEEISGEDGGQNEIQMAAGPMVNRQGSRVETA